MLRPLSGADLEKAPKLKLVHKLGAGVNTIDVDTAAKRGIAVANMPGANAPSVAEATVMADAGRAARLPELDRATREGRGWPTDPTLGDTVRDLGSCTVGLVGYGNVAKRVEQIRARDGQRHVVHTSSDARRLPHELGQPQRTAEEERHRLAAPAADRQATEGMIDADASPG